MWNNCNVVLADRMELQQKRFRKGALYVSAIVSDKSVVSIDCRYFVEEGNEVRATKFGIRVHCQHFEAFRKVLDSNPTEVEQHKLGSWQTRKLMARRCDDRYGKGIDFRYYRFGDGYEGWERRGIRLTDDDFNRFGRLVLRTGLLDCRLPTDCSLSHERRIVNSDARSDKLTRSGQLRGRQTPTQVDEGPDAGTLVRQALTEFLSRTE